MLDPKYFQRLRAATTPIGDRLIEPDLQDLPPGMVFKITGYSQVGDYILLSWDKSMAGESMTGESLWHLDSPIAHTGGRLDLEGIPFVRYKRNSIWDRVQLPDISVPKATAQELRNPANYRPIAV
jgi:hypothetical protein